MKIEQSEGRPHLPRVKRWPAVRLLVPLLVVFSCLSLRSPAISTRPLLFWMFLESALSLSFFLSLSVSSSPRASNHSAIFKLVEVFSKSSECGDLAATAAVVCITCVCELTLHHTKYHTVRYRRVGFYADSGACLRFLSRGGCILYSRQLPYNVAHSH